MIKSKLKSMRVALALACLLPSHFALANALNNGSFENTSSDWAVTGFQRLNSKIDNSGVTHAPTDGKWMMGVDITTPTSKGNLAQSFIFPANPTAITFDRNLIDPFFGSNDPLKALSVNV